MQANGMSAPWINTVFNKLWKKYSSPHLEKKLVKKINSKIESALNDANIKKALFTIEDVDLGTRVYTNLI